MKDLRLCRQYVENFLILETSQRPDRESPSLGEGRYCIEIMIESLFKDRRISWVRIVNGIDKYVTETSEEKPTENVDLFISTRKPFFFW